MRNIYIQQYLNIKTLTWPFPAFPPSTNHLDLSHIYIFKYLSILSVADLCTKLYNDTKEISHKKEMRMTKTLSFGRLHKNIIKREKRRAITRQSTKRTFKWKPTKAIYRNWIFSKDARNLQRTTYTTYFRTQPRKLKINQRDECSTAQNSEEKYTASWPTLDMEPTSRERQIERMLQDAPWR